MVRSVFTKTLLIIMQRNKLYNGLVLVTTYDKDAQRTDAECRATKDEDQLTKVTHITYPLSLCQEESLCVTKPRHLNSLPIYIIPRPLTSSIITHSHSLSKAVHFGFDHARSEQSQYQIQTATLRSPYQPWHSTHVSMSAT